MAYINNIKMFVRVYELGSMSAAARDQRTSPAVASARVGELEKHLGVRLFNRTTRSLKPTSNGRLFYEGALKILDAIAEAEATLTHATAQPRGTLFVAAPLGIGRRLIAPYVPAFKDANPEIELRLRLSDRSIDVTAEGLDLAFHIGPLEDSALKMRVITECPRILCAAPAYIAKRGMPMDGADLLAQRHDCLNLRFPGALEFQWTLQTASGPQRFKISGPFESDDGDVLTGWALGGHGIVMKPIFEVADHLRSGALVPVAEATPPLPVTLAALTPHKRLRDLKVSLFTDFIAGKIRAELAELDASVS
ncbi:LysR substrate-binding domain-containing protein [Roseinatronobacter sp.]